MPIRSAVRWAKAWNVSPIDFMPLTARDLHSGFQDTVPEVVSQLPVFLAEGEKQMLHYSLVFLVIALIAGILGFAGIAGTAAGIAKILFVVFLVIWLVSFLTSRRSV